MSIPVLMYHHVLPEPGFIASSESQFRSQMEWLVANRWTSLGADEFREIKRGEREAAPRQLLITFDDGWRDNLVHAYPVLKSLGLRATLFVVTGWIEAASQANRTSSGTVYTHKECKRLAPTAPADVLLTWDELGQMQDVFDIHPHTHTHRDDYFGTLSWQEDITLSRELLEKRLGIRSHHLCWPRGVYDQNTMALAQQAGFDTLYTTRRGANRVADGKLLEIKRLACKEDEQWLKRNLAIASRAWMADVYAHFKPE